VSLAVSFLFPLYLLGALAIGVPILLHLRRRPPKEHLVFSTLFFLEATPEQRTRRTRLEHWLLLALRCLAILLLALAFGRPYWSMFDGKGAEDSLRRTVILVDRSASMRREDLWAQAIAAVEGEIGKVGEKDEVAVAWFDEATDLVADFASWRGLTEGARQAAFAGLESSTTEPSWKGTDLGAALLFAADALLRADGEKTAREREIVLISDFTEGSTRSALAETAWPEEVLVRPVPIRPVAPGNLSIALATSPPRAAIDDPEVYRVRISNARDSASDAVILAWEGHPEASLTTVLAPGMSRIVASPPRPAEATRGVLAITGDAHDFDNRVFLSPSASRPLRVLFVGPTGKAEGAGSTLFYLRRALVSTPTLEPKVTASENLATSDLAATDVLVLSGTWTEDTASRLHEFAASGGLVMALPAADIAPVAFQTLVGEPTWTLRESNTGPEDFALLADLDFDHPVLQPFARAQIRDFSKIRFWKHRILDFGGDPGEATTVLATYDGESPAWVERRVGDGAIFSFLSSWEPAESQLTLSSKFVPLLYSILDQAGYSIRSAPTFLVGETSFTAPGLYEVPPTDPGAAATVSAVNLAPGEGLTSPFDPEVVLRDLGVTLADPSSSAAPELSPSAVRAAESADQEARQKSWKWLLLIALVFLIVETWLAGRRGSRARPGDDTPSAAGVPAPLAT